MIPPRKNLEVRRDHDKNRYKKHHEIGRLFNFLKPHGRLFSRLDEIAARLHAFLHFAATLLWIGKNHNRT